MHLVGELGLASENDTENEDNAKDKEDSGVRVLNLLQKRSRAAVRHGEFVLFFFSIKKHKMCAKKKSVSEYYESVYWEANRT